MALHMKPRSRPLSVSDDVALSARISSDGTFEFPNVVEGEYVIQADRGRTNPSFEGEFASVPITLVGGDVNGIVLQLSAGSAVNGRFEFETDRGDRRPVQSAVEISPIPEDPDLAPSSIATGSIQPDWTFHMEGITGRRRLQLTHLPDDWALKAILVGDQDVTDRPIAFGRANQGLRNVTIVLTDRISEISGIVVDDRNRFVPAVQVLAFSVLSERWYSGSRFLRRESTGPDGSFVIKGLPPGEFYICSIRELPTEGPDAWQEQSFLDVLSARATAVMVAEGMKRSITLRAPATRQP